MRVPLSVFSARPSDEPNIEVWEEVFLWTSLPGGEPDEEKGMKMKSAKWWMSLAGTLWLSVECTLGAMETIDGIEWAYYDGMLYGPTDRSLAGDVEIPTVLGGESQARQSQTRNDTRRNQYETITKEHT